MKLPLPKDPLVTAVIKAIIRIIYNKLINPAGLLLWPLSSCFTSLMTLTHPRSYAPSDPKLPHLDSADMGVGLVQARQ